jgi:hypothetical protein
MLTRVECIELSVAEPRASKNRSYIFLTLTPGIKGNQFSHGTGESLRTWRTQFRSES